MIALFFIFLAFVIHLILAINVQYLVIGLIAYAILEGAYKEIMGRK